MSLLKTLAVCSVFWGCGVKTAPRSSIVETPPAIPFKASNPSTKHSESNAKQTGESKDDTQSKH